MSLVPKLLEVEEFLSRNSVDNGFITETWLKDEISDSVVEIQGYKIIRKDRLVQQHGGVCVYIKNGIKFEIPDIQQSFDDHEVLWVKLEPNRSPRGFSCIMVAVVYHPPGADQHSFMNRLFESMSTVESKYPNCGFIVAGDFNRAKPGSLQRYFRLKQMVKTATRGQAILDLILTNMAQFYSVPTIFPPFGLSDHNTVLAEPKERTQGQSTWKHIIIRDMRKSNIDALGRYFSNIDWSIIKAQTNCESKLTTFDQLVKIGMNNIMPEKSRRIYSKDSPWMTVKLKNLIQLRQNAFHADKNSKEYKALRNAVNRERKVCKAKYYSSKVKDLKGCNPRKWWKEMKKLSGFYKNDTSNLLEDLLVPEFEEMSNQEIANAINSALLEPLQELDALDPSTLEINQEYKVLEVSPDRVYHLLRCLNKYKSPGPDAIPNWLLKEYAELLAEPLQIFSTPLLKNREFQLSGEPQT
jgi:hypothetical protein